MPCNHTATETTVPHTNLEVCNSLKTGMRAIAHRSPCELHSSDHPVVSDYNPDTPNTSRSNDHYSSLVGQSTSTMTSVINTDTPQCNQPRQHGMIALINWPSSKAEHDANPHSTNLSSHTITESTLPHKVTPFKHNHGKQSSHTPNLGCMQLAQNGYKNTRIPISLRAARIQF